MNVVEFRLHIVTVYPYCENVWNKSYRETHDISVNRRGHYNKGDVLGILKNTVVQKTMFFKICLFPIVLKTILLSNSFAKQFLIVNNPYVILFIFFK